MDNSCFFECNYRPYKPNINLYQLLRHPLFNSNNRGFAYDYRLGNIPSFFYLLVGIEKAASPKSPVNYTVMKVILMI